MDRREALEMARSLAPEASAEAQVVYAAYLQGSGAVEAPDAVTAVVPGRDGLYPVGTIALSDAGGTVLPWVREEDGWHLYSASSGYRYLPNRTTEDVAIYDTVVVGYVRPAKVQEVVWDGDYSDGAIARTEGGIYVKEFGGWFFYSPIDGFRYSIREVLDGLDPHFVGYIRPARDVNPFVGQSVLESDEGQYPVGTVALDSSRDVWYYDGDGKWSVYFKSYRGRRTASDVSTDQAPFWGAVVVA